MARASCLFFLCALRTGARAADESNARVLTLQQAVTLAVRNQPSLRQAYANVDVASARVEQARAGYLPQIALSAQYQRTTGNFVARPGATVSSSGMAIAQPGWTTRMFNYWNFGITGSQLIFDFGQTANRWRSAEATTDAARASGQAALAQVLYNVRRAYFDLRAQRELVRVATETLANQERHLTQVVAFVKAGLRPDIDRATVQTQLENARVQLIGAQNDEAIAHATLAQAIGLLTDDPFSPADEEFPAVAGEDEPLGRVLDEALRQRPELRAYERQKVAQQALVRAAQGAFGPALSLTGSASESGPALSNMVPNWAFGAQASWAIFQGGLTRGVVREAEANLRSIEAQEDGYKLAVRIDVEQALLAVRASKATGVAAERARVAARDQLRLAEGRYATGIGNAIELGDAQVAATQAEGQVVNARYALAGARAQLITALGRARAEEEGQEDTAR